MIVKRVGRLGVPGLLLLLFPGVTAGQQEGRLSEREEVTAVDLVVELSRDGETAVEPSVALRPEDFSIASEGEPLAVVGLDRSQALELWHLTVYFDHELTSTGTLRWAASALADRASSLVALGYVEVIAADPEPRRLLAPTRDAGLVDQTLSGVFLEAEAESRLLAEREEYLLQRGSETVLSSPEIVEQLVEEEKRLVIERQDALLNTLVDQVPRSARRAVFLVSEGFDPDPEQFYGRFAAVETDERETLADATEQWLRTIVGYGWVVIPVTIPEGEVRLRYGPLPEGTDRTWGFVLPGITRRLDGSLDPQRAAALHELGQELAEQGRLEEAEESLSEALGFYHGHSKYTLQRAAVLSDLGDVLLRLDRLTEARSVLREAVRLDPDRKSAYPFVEAELDGAQGVLMQLAGASAGWLTHEAEELTEALASMRKSLRLTFQFRGVADGRLHPIEASLPEQDFEVRAPRWVRFGTPPTVPALRTRRLLRGELEQGEIAMKCRFVQESSDYSTVRGVVEIQAPNPEQREALAERSIRLTLGIATEEGAFEVRQQEITWDAEIFTLPVTLERQAVWLAVVIDDPSGTLWGGATTEL
jgi:tetratricopeptide (TPR) repeat protein